LKWSPRGRNAKAVWQDLVDGHGFPGAYQSVKRFIRKLRGQQSLQACATYCWKKGTLGTPLNAFVNLNSE
jgi:hypothetical protein